MTHNLLLHEFIDSMISPYYVQLPCKNVENSINSDFSASMDGRNKFENRVADSLAKPPPAMEIVSSSCVLL